MKRRFLVTITLTALLCVPVRLRAGVSYDLSPAAVMDTRDLSGTTVALSAQAVLDTRMLDGLSSYVTSSAVLLDTRNTLVGTLSVVGPATVLTGSQTTYQCVLNLGGGVTSDITNNCTLRIASAPAVGVGIGGATLFVSASAGPSTVQLMASYQNASGQMISAALPVSIQRAFRATLSALATSTGGTNYTINLTGSANGGTAPYAFNWDTNSDGSYGEATGSNASFTKSSVGESFIVSLKVTDGTGTSAYTTQRVTLNKPLITDQPVVPRPALDPPPSYILGAQGQPFVFSETRKQYGLIVLTHGLHGSGQDQWLKTMAGNLQLQLGAQCPNIVIYDWKEGANILMTEGDRIKLKELLGQTRTTNAITGAISSVFEFETVAADFLTDMLAVRLTTGPQAGRRLMNWLWQNMGTNIDPQKPIHLIGHSAGGFCVGECGWRLQKDRSFSVDMVTMLDTPVPDFYHLFNLRSPGYIERYISTVYGEVETPDTWLIRPIFSNNHYRSNIVWLDPIWDCWLFDEYGHGWSYVWYTNTIFDCTPNGFYNSPIINFGTRINRSASMTLAAPKKPVTLQSSVTTTPDQPVDAFTTFGNVMVNANSYVLTEQSDAGLTQDLTIPVGAVALKFRYQFTTPGDGDFIAVNFADYPPFYIGEDMASSQMGPVEAEVPVSLLNSKTGKLTITLVSRGSANAVVQLQNLTFEMVDDPDHDGLTTTQELTLGTDPLLIDTDGDGLSDTDEVNLYSTNPLLADSDSDAVFDADELAAGSNPMNSASAFKIATVSKPSPGVFALSWSGVVGKTYRVQRSSDPGFGSYAVVGSGIAGVQPITMFTDSTVGVVAAAMFYRVEVEQ